MAINIEKLITQIDARYAAIDSNTSVLEQFRINQARDRLNNSGVNVLTYNSTGQLPSTADSAFLGTIAYVRTDNVFGDSDGAFYIATARDSGWVRVASTQDSGEAAIAAPGPPSYTGRQGSNYGYTAGGRNPGAPTSQTTIDKFSLSSDANATDVGDVTTPTLSASGHSSATNGYATTGQQSGTTYSNMIQRYPFASDGNAVDIGYDMAVGRRYATSGAHSETHGYVTGGASAGPPPPNTSGTNDIEKFAFTNDANGTDVGDLTVAKVGRAGQNSTTDGYASGGVDAPGSSFVNVIDKYSFTSDGNSTDVGDITGGPSGRYGGAGSSSTTHGYTAGGMNPPYSNIIDKFPFAADGNATDVGDIIATKRYGAGQTSTTHAYMSGGGSPYVDTIQKWSTSSDENASDIANLTVARDFGAPAQY